MFCKGDSRIKIWSHFYRKKIQNVKFRWNEIEHVIAKRVSVHVHSDQAPRL